MVVARTLPDLTYLDEEALRTLIVSQHQEIIAQHEQLLSHQSEIEHLKLLIAKLRRMQFGRKSEKLQQQIEQLELKLEELETAKAHRESPAMPASGALQKPVSHQPTRQALPEHLSREVKTYEPKVSACPDCGGGLRKLGEDVSEVLEYVPARFRVIRHVRPKYSCASCEHIVQEPAPSRPIERGLAGPGLLAHVLVAKYCDHQPLYRQSEMYAREGVELERSTLADWVGGASRLLTPLVAAISRHVLATTKLHADDIPVPVLAPDQDWAVVDLRSR
jgi:transposase